MRALLSLVILLASLGALLLWRLGSSSPPLEAHPQLPPDPSTGILVLGVEDSPAESTPSTAPTVPPPAPPSPFQKQEEQPLAEPEAPRPAAPAAPPAKKAPEVLHYPVVAGDTLYGILRRAYGRAPESLIEAVAAANQLSDPGRLRVGQVLVLPELPGFPSPHRP